MRASKIIILLLALQTIMVKSQLPTYNPRISWMPGKDTAWNGNPLKDGRYVNHEFPMNHSFSLVWKWKKKKNPYDAEKKIDTFQLPVSDDWSDFLDSTQEGIFWLGHATFLIRLGGKTLITDPVFNKATVVKRESPFPIEIEKLKGIDYVLISHDHRDHLDKTSLRKLIKLNPNIQYFTGLSMDKILSGFLKGAKGQTAGWYQKYITEGFELYFLPTRHWCKRSIGDTNKRLWGAFLLKIGGKTIYFGGDSGYGSHYADLKKWFPEINLAILGIGAYEPEWFMESNHTSPAKAYQAFKDMEADYLVPMHYGTFDLSDEPLGKPLKVIKGIKNEQAETAIILPRLGDNILKMMKD